MDILTELESLLIVLYIKLFADPHDKFVIGVGKSNMPTSEWVLHQWPYHPEHSQ